MFQRFFVPLDGSTCAEKAIPVAANLARTCEGTVIFARVLVPPAGADEYTPTILANEMCLAQPKIVVEARDYLDEVLERYAEALEGIDDLITEVVPGHVPSTLLELSDQEHSDLIVMRSRGDSWLKRWVVGSVTQETFRHSLLPMLVLSERGNTLSLEGNPLRILVPLDGPASAEAILKPVFHLLSRVLALAPHTIHLFQVIATPPATGHFRSVANITDALQKEEQQAAAQALQALVSIEYGSGSVCLYDLCGYEPGRGRNDRQASPGDNGWLHAVIRYGRVGDTWKNRDETSDAGKHHGTRLWGNLPALVGCLFIYCWI